MFRTILFSLSMCLTVVVGSLYQARQQRFEEFMLIKSGRVGTKHLALVDPITDTQIVLTNDYYDISLLFEDDGWIYYWGIKANEIALYRFHVQKNTHQKILDDTYSPFLTQVLLSQDKIIYVRDTGIFATVRLDGSYNQDLPLVAQQRYSFSESSSLRTSQDKKSVIFSQTQDGNQDIYQLAIDGSEIHNLTVSLPTPHRCVGGYSFEKLIIFRCNDIYYYQRSDQPEIYELLPDHSTQQQSISIRDENEVVIKTNEFPIKSYSIDISSSNDPLPYTETEETNIVKIKGCDWKLVLRDARNDLELWYIKDDGTENLIYSTPQVPIIRPWQNNSYLLVDEDRASSADIYRLAGDGSQLKHLYHSTHFLAGINYGAGDKDFYFLERTESGQLIYLVHSISPNGTVHKLHEWPHSNRFLQWTDIFVRDWSPIKWLIGSGLANALLCAIILYKSRTNSRVNQQV